MKLASTLQQGSNEEPIQGKKWGRKILAICFIFAALFWGWSKLSNPETFPVRSVKIIDVSTHIDHQTIQRTIIPYLENGMLWLNISRLQNAIAELPWVQQVILTRKWPDQLVIQIIEQVPIARWNNTQLLNKQGDVFMPDASTFPPNIPSLYGPQNQQNTVWQAYNAINQLLAPISLEIASITMLPDQAWDITLNNGLHLLLGQDDVINRIKRFTAVYPKIFVGHTNDVDYVDMRYSDGLAIKWKNNSAKT